MVGAHAVDDQSGLLGQLIHLRFVDLDNQDI